MLVIAHRGASVAHPENTLEAFIGAVAQGADGIELDVRRTADARFAVSHDDTLPDGRALVDTAFDDLPAHVTHLAAALDVAQRLRVVNTEIKNWPDDRDFDPTEALADAVVALLAERGELDDPRHLISCFHLPTVDRVHELAPGLATAWLLGLIDDIARLVDTAAARRARGDPPPPPLRRRAPRGARPRCGAGGQHLDLRRARSDPGAGGPRRRCRRHQRA